MDYEKIKNEEPDISKLKVIIFDFDDTLYSGGSWDNFYPTCYNFLASVGVGKDAAEVEYLFNTKYAKYHPITTKASVYFAEHDMDVNLLYDYFNKNIYDITSEKMQYMDYSLLKKLAKNYVLCMVTDSPENYIKHYAQMFGLDLSVFTKIYCNKHESSDFSKSFYISKCVSEMGAKPKEAVMIGDNFNADILPARNVKIQTKYVHSVKDTEEFVKKLIEAKKK